jgi:hypothetical protein
MLTYAGGNADNADSVPPENPVYPPSDTADGQVLTWLTQEGGPAEAAAV